MGLGESEKPEKDDQPKNGDPGGKESRHRHRLKQDKCLLMLKIPPFDKALGILLAGLLLVALTCTAGSAVSSNEIWQYKAVWTADGKTIEQSRTIWTVEDNSWFKISLETIYQNKQLVGEREHLLLKDKSFLDSEYNRSIAAGHLYDDANLTRMSMITSLHNETKLQEVLANNVGAEGPLTFSGYAPEYVRPPYLK